MPYGCIATGLEIGFIEGTWELWKSIRVGDLEIELVDDDGILTVFYVGLSLSLTLTTLSLSHTHPHAPLLPPLLPPLLSTTTPLSGPQRHDDRVDFVGSTRGHQVDGDGRHCFFVWPIH